MRRAICSSAAIAVHRPDTIRVPVVVSIAHAGRIYPQEILTDSRVDQSVLERLEDSWSDLIARRATEAGATIVEALWARAVADCNRGEGQMAPSDVAPAMRSQFSMPGRKERAGLGVVPTRLAEAGPLWKRPIDRAGLDWRLNSFHRPFHATLTTALAETHARFGHAILIDLHSMPPIPSGQAGHGAGIVIGDRFGDAADDWLADCVAIAAEGLGVPVSRNRPYAGGHIIRTHGRPDRGVHAVQIEIDRTMYLDCNGSPNSRKLGPLTDWFHALVTAAAAARPRTAPQCAAQ